MTSKAIALISARLRSDGMGEVKYRFSDGSKKTFLRFIPPGVSVTAGASLLEKAWLDLDDLMEELMSDPQNQNLRGQARGMARLLALFMPPHFTTADEIALEAKRRYEAKKAGTEYETPGLMSRRYEPPPGSPSKYEVPRGTKQEDSSRAAKAASKFTAQEQQAIKFAAESGMFTAEQLAKTYGTSVAVIKQIIA